jgi:Fe-S cluster assembly scaffold protein SufB
VHRTLVVGAESSEFRVHEYDLAEDFGGDPEDGGQALHAGAFEMYLQDGARCRLAQVQDWASGEVFDVSTRYVGVGRDAYCHWLPSLLGGALIIALVFVLVRHYRSFYNYDALSPVP